jgi:hypothetical protein
MSNFSQAQLDSFWSRYVTMSAADAVSVSEAEPEFAAMRYHCVRNRLYGFADYQAPNSLGVVTNIGRNIDSDIVNRPSK